ncbi:hypothetical protein [Nonomuraea sp. NPDC050786]|uniref:hypothetical protein n=1 Tax=Nonomuraea sp. NPDC050786 TaxID=3154840 RepID=UPI0033E651B5
MNATITAPAPSAFTPDSDQAKVWEVRLGSTGRGAFLFDVYTTDMAAARKAVENVIKHLTPTWADNLTTLGFTVHALRPDQERHWTTRLRTSFLAVTVPAPDYIES